MGSLSFKSDALISSILPEQSHNPRVLGRYSLPPDHTFHTCSPQTPSDRIGFAFVGMMLQHTLQAKDFVLFGKCNLQILHQNIL